MSRASQSRPWIFSCTLVTEGKWSSFTFIGSTHAHPSLKDSNVKWSPWDGDGWLSCMNATAQVEHHGENVHVASHNFRSHAFQKSHVPTSSHWSPCAQSSGKRTSNKCVKEPMVFLMSSSNRVFYFKSFLTLSGLYLWRTMAPPFFCYKFQI